MKVRLSLDVSHLHPDWSRIRLDEDAAEIILEAIKSDPDLLDWADIRVIRAPEDEPADERPDFEP